MIADKSGITKGALAIAILFLLGYGQSAKAEDNSETVRKTFLEKYSQFAFAAGDRLVKPSAVPDISYLCSNRNCQKTIEDLNRLVPREAEQTRGDVLRSEKLIDVLFFVDDADRSKNDVRYDLNPKLKVALIDDAKCAVARFTEGFEVKKVVIAVVGDAGPRNNLICILTEMLRGSGLSFQDKYKDYSQSYKRMSDQKFLQALNGLSNLMRVHWSKQTSPGMKKEEVFNRLSDISIQELHN
jgi:hypothetical protein